jgi:phosphoribosylformylglycinamidine cyclo-ligase
MEAIVAADQAEAQRAVFADAGHTVYELGSVIAGEGVSYTGSLL